MAFNRRGGLNNIGVRRNPHLGNNFVPGGHLANQNNRPLQHGPPRPFNNHSNGNFRPHFMRKPPCGPPLHPPPIHHQHLPPQQQRMQAPPPQQQPPTVEPQDYDMDTKPFVGSQENYDIKANNGFWVNNKSCSRVAKRERRRRHVRMTRTVQPKNAIMILNELVQHDPSYTVIDLPHPSDINQFQAQVLVEGITHSGLGRSKIEAKNNASEAALKYIFKNRQFSALRPEVTKNDDTSDSSEEPCLPWQHVASFALYKLLNTWGEDPNQLRNSSEDIPQPSSQNRPAKRIPENAIHMNPVMLANQNLPHVQFEELEKQGSAPAIIFSYKCTVEGQSFTGSGTNKKTAKKMAAYAVCEKILEVEYPPEIYSSTTPTVKNI